MLYLKHEAPPGLPGLCRAVFCLFLIKHTFMGRKHCLASPVLLGMYAECVISFWRYSFKPPSQLKLAVLQEFYDLESLLILSSFHYRVIAFLN